MKKKIEEEYQEFLKGLKDTNDKIAKIIIARAKNQPLGNEPIPKLPNKEFIPLIEDTLRNPPLNSPVFYLITRYIYLNKIPVNHNCVVELLKDIIETGPTHKHFSLLIPACHFLGNYPVKHICPLLVKFLEDNVKEGDRRVRDIQSVVAVINTMSNIGCEGGKDILTIIADIGKSEPYPSSVAREALEKLEQNKNE